MSLKDELELITRKQIHGRLVLKCAFKNKINVKDIDNICIDLVKAITDHLTKQGWAKPQEETQFIKVHKDNLIPKEDERLEKIIEDELQVNCLNSLLSNVLKGWKKSLQD